jgi:LEA14-like dessication related protein
MRHHSFLPSVTAFSFISLLIAGCSSMNLQKWVKAPDVQFESFQLTDLSLSSLSSIVKVKVTNPNSLPIPLGKFTYQLKILDEEFQSGSIDPTQNLLSANESMSVSLPVTLSLSRIQKIMSSLSKTSEIPFEVNGNLSAGGFTLPVAKKGMFPKPEIPKISLEQLKVEKAGIEATEMSVGLKIVNPNAFPLKLGKFAGGISVGENSLVNTAGILDQIGAKKEGVIKLPFIVKTSDLGSGILSMISGNAKSVSLKGNWVRPGVIPGSKEITETFEKTAQLKVGK